MGRFGLRNHRSNHIPLGTRIFYFLSSFFLIFYGTFGLITDDLFIPGKRGPGITKDYIEFLQKLPELLAGYFLLVRSFFRRF